MKRTELRDIAVEVIRKDGFAIPSVPKELWPRLVAEKNGEKFLIEIRPEIRSSPQVWHEHAILGIETTSLRQEGEKKGIRNLCYAYIAFLRRQNFCFCMFDIADIGIIGIQEGSGFVLYTDILRARAANASIADKYPLYLSWNRGGEIPCRAHSPMAPRALSDRVCALLSRLVEHLPSVTPGDTKGYLWDIDYRGGYGGTDSVAHRQSIGNV